MTDDDEPLGPEQPRSLRELFLAFQSLALQGFGGVMPIAYAVLVEQRRWLTPAQFAERVAIAQVLPGPNIINLSFMLGDRWLGWRGAAAASLGLLLVPALLVIALAVTYRSVSAYPPVVHALRGMGAVAAGLVIGTGIKLGRTLATSPLGRWHALAIAVLTFVAIALLRWPQPAVVGVLGAWGIAWAWRGLGARP